MSDGLFAVLCIGALALFIGAIVWFIAAHPEPCQGGWSIHGQTGVYKYDGHTVRCFRGNVVEVKP